VPDVVNVFGRHRNLGQRTLWREYHVLQALSLVVEYNIENFVIFAVIVGCFDPHVLPIRVLLAGSLEFLLLGCETANDFFRSDALGL
jgi:hypothetical protein